MHLRCHAAAAPAWTKLRAHTKLLHCPTSQLHAALMQPAALLCLLWLVIVSGGARRREGQGSVLSVLPGGLTLPCSNTWQEEAGPEVGG